MTTQSLYDFSIRLDSKADSGSFTAKVLRRLAAPVWKKAFTPDKTVKANLWGRTMELPANHHLPWILRHYPFWGQPLVHTAKAIAKTPLRVVDVGANIGDSVAMLEVASLDCRYLCIEPDPVFAALCQKNLIDTNTEVVRTFVGEVGTRAKSDHHAPGTAGTRLSSDGEMCRPLDDIATEFRADLIKVDTDGFDFKVLRTADSILRKQHPTLFFEMHVPFWEAAGERAEAIFPWLAERGYHHFSFFVNTGHLQSSISDPSPTFIESIVSVSHARATLDGLHFDILATTDESIRDRAAKLNLEAISHLP